MPNKLTDAEVKKALEEYIEFSDFEYTEYTSIRIDVLQNALDLINRQEVRIHQQEKTIMEIQNANLIDFKAKIGNYIAENKSLKAEVERLQNILICFMEALGKVRNVDDIDSISLIPLMSELNKGIRAEIKAEAYKEAFEKVKEELKNIARIDWQGGYYYLIGEAFFDNLLNDLVGDADGKDS